MKLRIALRHAQDFFDRIVLKFNVLVLRRVHERSAGGDSVEQFPWGQVKRRSA
jgi:hypothetical protein